MEVQIEFTFNGSTLGGKQLVTFEELYDMTNPEEPKKVTEHKDIDDEGQTVTIKEVPETSTPETPGTITKTSNSPKMGDTANAVLWIAILVLSAAGITGVRIWNKKKQVKEALGERGTPGNAEYIIYVAEKLIEVYKSDHLWALDFKCISVPEMFEKLIEYTSELSKSIIEDIENFIDDYDKRINELSYGLEDISGEKVVSFNLELRSPDMNKIDAEIKRLGKILLNN